MIEKYAFDDCDQLEKVTVDPSSEFFFSQDGCLYSKTLPKRCLVIPRMVKGTVVVPDDAWEENVLHCIWRISPISRVLCFRPVWLI